MTDGNRTVASHSGDRPVPGRNARELREIIAAVHYAVHYDVMRTMKTLYQTLVALALSAVLPAIPACAEGPPVDLRILAIDDFHGNLQPPPGGITIADPADRSKKIVVPAGGSETLATLVKQLAEGHKNTIFVAAGDLIGA
ncbi:MAG TPA: hypothetical protein VKB78_15505, partial [Pirellulales bacterium]|nr:hypothetical protein [Pirellulales bacterium]